MGKRGSGIEIAHQLIVAIAQVILIVWRIVSSLDGVIVTLQGLNDSANVCFVDLERDLHHSAVA